MEYLIRKGADINCKNNAGANLLIIASFSGHLHVVKFLLESNYAFNFDINQVDNYRCSAFIVALLKDHFDIVQYFYEQPGFKPPDAEQLMTTLAGRKNDIGMKPGVTLGSYYLSPPNQGDENDENYVLIAPCNKATEELLRERSLHDNNGDESKLPEYHAVVQDEGQKPKKQAPSSSSAREEEQLGEALEKLYLNDNNGDESEKGGGKKVSESGPSSTSSPTQRSLQSHDASEDVTENRRELTAETETTITNEAASTVLAKFFDWFNNLPEMIRSNIENSFGIKLVLENAQKSSSLISSTSDKKSFGACEASFTNTTLEFSAISDHENKVILKQDSDRESQPNIDDIYNYTAKLPFSLTNFALSSGSVDISNLQNGGIGLCGMMDGEPIEHFQLIGAI